MPGRSPTCPRPARPRGGRRGRRSESGPASCIRMAHDPVSVVPDTEPPMRPLATSLVALALGLAGCSGTGATASPAATAAPSAEPTGSAGVVVTFDVTGEHYRIELTDAADIEIARRLLAGQEAPAILNGVVI